MNKRGTTLVELLIAMIISAIAILAIAAPFMAERSFWARGKRRVEAQRDAQMVMRAIAHVARPSTGCDAHNPAELSCTSTSVSHCETLFQTSGAQFQMIDGCQLPAKTITLIDGIKSAVTKFATAPIIGNKVVKVELEITREGKEKALLVTQVFARNAG